MITLIFNCSRKDKNNLLELPELEGLYDLGVIFDTIDSRDQFVKQFPKSLKIYVGFITGFENGTCVKYPYISAKKQSTRTHNRTENKITGAVNETGDNRLSRVYNALKIQLESERSVNA